MKKIFFDKKGTSLIELIVGIAIIAIVTGTVLANFRTGERTNELHGSTQKLVSEIRNIQNFAMSLKSFNGAIPDGGWGLFFNNQGSSGLGYKIFADTDGDHHCQNFNNCPSGNNDFVEAILFSNGIEISNINAGGVNTSRLYVSFEPPNPTVYMCISNPTLDCTITEAEITLSNDNGSDVIVINKFGLIDIK